MNVTFIGRKKVIWAKIVTEHPLYCVMTGPINSCRPFLAAGHIDKECNESNYFLFSKWSKGEVSK
jgi:hypothetical protein